MSLQISRPVRQCLSFFSLSSYLFNTLAALKSLSNVIPPLQSAPQSPAE